MFTSITNSLRQFFSAATSVQHPDVAARNEGRANHQNSNNNPVDQLLIESPHERGLSRNERSIASVTPWMRGCVRILTDPETTLTDQRRVSLGIAREVADGGRASRYAFFEAIRLEGRGRTAAWGTLLEVATVVYRDFMRGLEEPYVGSDDVKDKLAHLRRNIHLRFAPSESHFSYIDSFEDLYSHVSPNFLCRTYASALREVMRTINTGQNNEWVDTFFAPGPRILEIARSEIGVQTGSHLFLFPATQRNEVEQAVQELVLELSLYFSAERVCDVIRLACQKPLNEEELSHLLVNELDYKSNQLVVARLSLLSQASLGRPDEHGLALHRVDRTVAPSVEDAEDYVRMVTHPMRLLIQETLSIKIEKIPLQEQFYLLDLLRSNSVDSLQQLTEPLRLLGEPAARAFIVCEYNTAHADTLKRWMRESDPSSVRDRLSLLCNCLDALWSFSTELKNHVKSSGVSNICENVPNEITEALLRRIVDLFVASISSDLTQSANIAPGQVDDALRGMSTLLAILGDVSLRNRFTLTRLDPNALQSSPEGLIFSISDSVTGGTMKLKMLFRPRSNDVGEARWNIELCFPKDFPDEGIYNAFLHTTRHARSGQQTTASVLRVGLDYDMSGNTPRISLDVGRSPFTGQYYQCDGCVIGRILSRVSVDGSGHHNTLSFPTQLAQPEEFARAVNLMRSYFPPEGTETRALA